MYDQDPVASVTSSQDTNVTDPDQSPPEPHFLDAEPIHHAQPAVPLSEVRYRRLWPVVLILITALAGLAGGLLGSVLLHAYRNSADEGHANVTTTQTGNQPSGQTAQTANAQEAQASSNVSAEQTATNNVQPGALPSVESQKASNDNEVNSQESQNSSAVASQNSTTPQSDADALRSALNDWIAATNARDINRQMSFYNHTVNAFYLTRNVSAAEVRAEKVRVISRASYVDIQAGQPAIHISPGGRSATMRFIKRYSILSDGQTRAGEVLQELRWQRMNGNWKIVSERDLEVLQ